MTETERYLRAATRGLWGRRCRELRLELLSHIEVRVQEFRLSGLSEAEAERQTLRELGAAREVSGGMVGVHTLPVAYRSGLAGVLAATLLLTALPQGQAQVRSIFADVPNAGASGYLDFGQLQVELSQTGGKLAGTPADATVTVPGAPRPNYPVQKWPGTTLTQDGHTYIHLGTFVNALVNSGADLHLSGWTNPTLKAGQANIRIQTADRRVLSDLYGATLMTTRIELTAGLPLFTLQPNTTTGEVTLKGKFQPDRIYALLLPTVGFWNSKLSDGTFIDSGQLMLKASVNAAGNGKITFYNDAQHFKLSPSVEAFQKALDPYRQKFPQWNAKNPAPALLLALSGHFGQDAYTVVPPSQVQRR